MEMLPDLRIPRVLPGLRVRMYARETLRTIPADENFCAVMISARSRLPKDLPERARWAHHIPGVMFPANFASVELAVAMLNEEAVRFGWRFLVPMNGTRFEELSSPAFVSANHPDTLAALAELDKIVHPGNDPGWDNYMQGIGAKGRKDEYMAFVENPTEFALGIRLDQAVAAELQPVTSERS